MSDAAKNPQGDPSPTDSNEVEEIEEELEDIAGGAGQSTQQPRG